MSASPEGVPDGADGPVPAATAGDELVLAGGRTPPGIRDASHDPVAIGHVPRDGRP